MGRIKAPRSRIEHIWHWVNFQEGKHYQEEYMRSRIGAVLKKIRG